MKRNVFVLGAIVLGLAAVAAASDAWKDKPYQSWDQKDVLKILNDSPWSQSVVVQVDNPLSNLDANANGVGRIGESETRPDSSTNAKYVARWSSSRTVREALFRGDQLNGKAAPNAEQWLANTPKTYQIVIVSSDLTDFVNAGEEQLRKSAYLETKKSKQRVAPSNAQFIKTEDGRSVAQILIEFPKQNEKGEATLAPDEKGVDFFAAAGKTKLKFHFDLSKMADKDGVDL